MKTVILVLLLLLGVPAVQAQIVLDDFSGIRPNPGNENTPLFAVYNGEDPGQSFTISGGLFRVTASSSAAMYWHFLPYPYTGVKGFAKGWIESGIWNANVNRLKFAFSCDRNISKTARGYGNIQIGTYVKTDDGNPSNQGAHFYHHIDPNIYSGRIVYVDINRTPQHQVGTAAAQNWPENPTAPKFNYFDGLTRWYFDTQEGNWSGARCEFRPVIFELVSGEPDQLVSSVTYQYTGTRYEMTWSGPKNSTLQFDVAYSQQSMKSSGFASGTPGGTVAATGNDYTNVIWASPAMAEIASGLYIAVRPQSQSAFTQVFVPGPGGSTPPPIPQAPAAPTGLVVN